MTVSTDAISAKTPCSKLEKNNEVSEDTNVKKENIEVFSSNDMNDIDEDIKNCDKSIEALEQKINYLSYDSTTENKLLVLPFGIASVVATMFSMSSIGIASGNILPKLSKFGRYSTAIGAFVGGAAILTGLLKLGKKIDNNNKESIQQRNGEEIKKLQQDIEELKKRKEYLIQQKKTYLNNA